MLFTWFQIIQLGCRFANAGYCGIRQLSWKIFRFNIATRFCRFLFYSLHFLWITNNFQSIDFQIWYTVLPVSFSSNFLTTLFVSAICTLVSGDGNDTLNSSRINAIISVYISNEWIQCSYLLTWSPIQRLFFHFNYLSQSVLSKSFWNSCMFNSNGLFELFYTIEQKLPSNSCCK